MKKERNNNNLMTRRLMTRKIPILIEHDKLGFHYSTRNRVPLFPNLFHEESLRLNAHKINSLFSYVTGLTIITYRKRNNKKRNNNEFTTVTTSMDFNSVIRCSLKLPETGRLKYRYPLQYDVFTYMQNREEGTRTGIIKLHCVYNIDGKKLYKFYNGSHLKFIGRIVKVRYNLLNLNLIWGKRYEYIYPPEYEREEADGDEGEEEADGDEGEEEADGDDEGDEEDVDDEGDEEEADGDDVIMRHLGGGIPLTQFVRRQATARRFPKRAFALRPAGRLRSSRRISRGRRGGLLRR